MATRKVLVSFTLQQETIDRIDELRKSHTPLGVSVGRSHIIRSIVEDWLAKNDKETTNAAP